MPMLHANGVFGLPEIDPEVGGTAAGCFLAQPPAS